MPKIFTSKSQKTGETGENIAVRFLMKHGFRILGRNYTRKWGEIDIIAENNNKIHFIEVKSVSRETLNGVLHDLPALQEQAGTSGQYRPEDNMHPWKLKRLGRTIETYLLSEKVPEDKEWQMDLVIVYLCLKDKKARVKIIENIIL